MVVDIVKFLCNDCENVDVARKTSRKIYASGVQAEVATKAHFSPECSSWS